MKIYLFLTLLFCSFCFGEVEENKKPIKDLVETVGVLGLVGVATADATIGEIFVRAYPSHTILEKSFSNGASLILSCDTLRAGSAARYVAAAKNCQIEFTLEVAKNNYTLTGPFRENMIFEGRSCKEARNTCSEYKVEVTQDQNSILLKSGDTTLGIIDLSQKTPAYK